MAQCSPSARGSAMRKWPPAVAIAFAMSLLAGTPSPADDRDTCAKESGETAIAACTRAIQSKKFKGRDLAAVYNSRGSAYGSDLDRAIADYTEAIRLDPK